MFQGVHGIFMSFFFSFCNHFSAKQENWSQNEAENESKMATVNDPIIDCSTIYLICKFCQNINIDQKKFQWV